MTTDLQTKADARFAAALAASGARDPRDYYRARLRDLKRSNPKGTLTPSHITRVRWSRPSPRRMPTRSRHGGSSDFCSRV